MAEKRKKNAPRDFDIHRTLPVNPRQPHTQGRHATRRLDQTPPEQTAVPETPRPLWRRILRWIFRTFLFLIIAVLIFLIVIGIWDGRNISAFSSKMFGSSNLISLAKGGSLQTDSNGRVNVLIVGYSIDDPNHQGAQLTDSILLLSMNPKTHTGYLLSIPRDLYVAIPGNGYGKINEVYEDGGMSLLEQVVNTDFATDINYYAIIDYGAVKSIVNALGGINVTINSPEGRLYDPNKDWSTGGPLVDLSNGTHHLNGEQALDLTRARGDPSQYGQPVGFGQSDFQRTADQRLVFNAIKAKLNWKLLLDPRKNDTIFTALANNLKTNIPVGAARPLFGLFNSIPNSQLKSISLNSFDGKNLLQSYFTYSGQDALVPAAGPTDYSQIDAALQQLNSD